MDRITCDGFAKPRGRDRVRCRLGRLKLQPWNFDRMLSEWQNQVVCVKDHIAVIVVTGVISTSQSCLIVELRLAISVIDFATLFDERELVCAAMWRFRVVA
jgi:hypothetical protein